MRIAHLCLSCFYIDGFSYQENELVAQNVSDGHEVVVIASTETYGLNRQLTYCESGVYMGQDGARVIRLPYCSWLPQVLMRKLRAHPHVYSNLEAFKPDVILFHGLCGWELLAAAKYAKKHPSIKLYIDSHEDFNNSARSFVSKNLLHAAYYRPIAKYCLKFTEKVLCISVDTLNFVREFYGFPESALEFYPLGGKIFEDSEYSKTRKMARANIGVADGQILFVQSGKMDRSKKLLESLKIFTSMPDSNFRFFLAGHLHEDISAEVGSIIANDPRIQFLGWKTAAELRELLCATDVYVQPGTQSATMQMSLCCRCAVILDDVSSHKPFVDGNGWLVGKTLTLMQAFDSVSKSANALEAMSDRSAAIARQLLDYRTLAARLYC